MPNHAQERQANVPWALLMVALVGLVALGLTVFALARQKPTTHWLTAPTMTHTVTMTPTPSAPDPALTGKNGSHWPTRPKVAITKSQAPVSPVSPMTIRYTVRSGDNLTEIAAHYHLASYAGLYAANHVVIGTNPNLIRPGEVLVIPAK